MVQPHSLCKGGKKVTRHKLIIDFLPHRPFFIKVPFKATYSVAKKIWLLKE